MITRTMSQIPSELHTILQNLHLHEEDQDMQVHKQMFELLAELLMPDDPDLAFIAMASYIIKTPASHKVLLEYKYIADYLRRLINENMNTSPHLLSICGELAAILARI